MAGTLRAGGPAWERLEQPAIVYVDPDDGATGVFADAAVILRSSHPLDERSVRDGGLCVRDSSGTVPGEVRLADHGRVVMWNAARPLAADVVHFVVAAGLRDLAGHEVPSHVSRFVPCGLRTADLAD